MVGAGNAALSAALSAHEAGARVTVLEKAPLSERGGNTFFTGGAFRFPYKDINTVCGLIDDLSEAELAQIDVGSYSEKNFHADLVRVTDGLADEDLVRVLVNEAEPTMRWLRDNGVRWVLMYGRQANRIEDKLVFYGGLILEAVGGGKGLSDQQFEAVGRAGIEIQYETKMTGLLIEKGVVVGVKTQTRKGEMTIQADAVILAAGGFEANAEMRARYLGANWDLAKVRGSRFNTGDAIRYAIDAGAHPYGHWSGAHAVAWDLNAPQFGNRSITDLYQKHSYPYGVIVNINGERFVDEGADFRNYTYAKYGRSILEQPLRTAFQIFDQKTVSLLRDEYRIRQATRAEAESIQDLAHQLGIDVDGFSKTIERYNASCVAGEYNPSILDGVHTKDLIPPKSNWALPIDTPPYVGFAVTCGITFTFGGLKINPKTGQVLDTEDINIPGLYAAGELIGGLFYDNYAGGSGLMAGAVFGRIAGHFAAIGN